MAALVLLVNSAMGQSQRIMVQGSGAPQVFTDLTEAIAAAQANDVLYLSGGSFPYTGGLVLDLNSWPVSGTSIRQWDISPLASGTYLLRIISTNSVWSTRFVKP